MRHGWVAMLALAACVSMPASSDVLSPVRDAKPAAIAEVKPASTDVKPDEKPADKPDDKPSAGGSFDFEKDDRDPNEKPAPSAGPVTPAELYAGLGLDAKAATAAPVPAPAPVPVPTMTPVDPNTWGVRLLSTVADAQPPRAVLGLADGKEIVVTPGQLIPEARVIVLAVGRDRAQIAEVTPEGDHATVRASMLEALYPGGSPPAH
jgi:hypothetical protein